MKNNIITTVLIGILGAGSFAFAADNPLHGKIIALDAGHGNGETGAVNNRVLKADGTPVTEAEVNWDVVQTLETTLENTYGAHVVVAERYSTRRDRVNDAVAKCAAREANVPIQHVGECSRY